MHFDWYYRADDDTYAIIENLRLMLSNYSTEQPIYFGFNVNALYAEGRDFEFVATGPGLLLSRYALRLAS